MKLNISFTLGDEYVAILKEEKAKTGVPMSRQIEDLIRARYCGGSVYDKQ